MNLLKKTTIVILCAIAISSTIQCTSSKSALAPQQITEVKLQKPIIFQEWYAGIKVGGTGVNMFIPKFESNPNMKVDSVFFRNMKGQLIEKDAMYSVILKNDSKDYVPNPSNQTTNPFNLTGDECMIAYSENGQTKYLKIATAVEKAGTYYENGPPSIYDNSPASIIATVDED
ncbi:MAG: hypothetical protein ACSHXF_02565 [Aquaticitalea sp.]